MSATAPSPLPTRHLPTLDDEVSTDPATVGHKAATLARLRRAGHRVPPALVVPVQLAASLGDGPAADVLPPDIRHELEEAIAGLGVVAVRSSGVVEDRPDASWAGQYESVLGVRSAAEPWDAIDRCAASAWSARATGYGRDTGTGPGPMAVMVQQQVEAEAAGVAFTANPVTGDDEVLVSAVRGLADRLVAGEVDPEEWAQRPGAPPVRKGGPETVLGPADVAEVAREAAPAGGCDRRPRRHGVGHQWRPPSRPPSPAHHRPARPA